VDSRSREYWFQTANCGNPDITVLGCLDAYVLANGVRDKFDKDKRPACWRCPHGKKVREAVSRGEPIPESGRPPPPRCNSAVARGEVAIDHHMLNKEERALAEEARRRLEEREMAAKPKFKFSRRQIAWDAVRAFLTPGMPFTATGLLQALNVAEKATRAQPCGYTAKYIQWTVFENSYELLTRALIEAHEKPEGDEAVVGILCRFEDTKPATFTWDVSKVKSAEKAKVKKAPESAGTEGRSAAVKSTPVSGDSEDGAPFQPGLAQVAGEVTTPVDGRTAAVTSAPVAPVTGDSVPEGEQPSAPISRKIEVDEETFRSMDQQIVRLAKFLGDCFLMDMKDSGDPVEQVIFLLGRVAAVRDRATAVLQTPVSFSEIVEMLYDSVNEMELDIDTKRDIEEARRFERVVTRIQTVISMSTVSQLGETQQPVIVTVLKQVLEDLKDK